MKHDILNYKQQNIKTWNEVANRYHKRWSNTNIGLFQSAKKLVELLSIRKNDLVLDIACGTGILTKEILHKIGKTGYVVGIDTSASAIEIAKNGVKIIII